MEISEMNENPLQAGQAVIDELLCIADTKWVLGHWYIKVMQNGRALTDFNALAAMSQDELGHTRAIFSLLEQNNPGAADYLEFKRAREQIHSMAMLDAPPRNWGDFIITALLAEQALRLLFDYAPARHAGLAALSAKCRQECAFHALYFDGSLEGFQGADRRDAAEALALRFPMALEWFAHQGGGDPVHEAGYRSETLAALHAAFLDQCRRRLLKFLPEAGAALAAQAASPGIRWDPDRRRPMATAVPAALWEFILPTNEHAVMCRRPLEISAADSIRFTTV